ncbi:MAG: hypothetical protein IJH87_01170, partial [Atopobiaceae bacterium]|nr:hypothetical protein [Atopobiaceae bacterium]
MARNTRFIASTHYTRWKHLRNLVWAIMAFNLVRVLLAEGAELIAVTASSEAPLMAVVSSLIVIFIETVFVSFFPIVGWYAFCTFMISRARRESTFTPVADIEFFREKLDGLAPATVSLLADLRIERRNDICASLLRLALDGAISL